MKQLRMHGMNLRVLHESTNSTVYSPPLTCTYLLLALLLLLPLLPLLLVLLLLLRQVLCRGR
jgi:hypothetical protein